MEDLEAIRAICADTDVIVDYLRGREPGKSAFIVWRKKANVFITSVTAFELLLGANISSKRERRVIEVESLLDQHGILTFTRDSAEKAAEEGARLKAEGATLEIRDLFNASMCMLKKMPILTENKAHYERIKDLTVLMP